jgi:hypothetical protein
MIIINKIIIVGDQKLWTLDHVLNSLHISTHHIDTFNMGIKCPGPAEGLKYFSVHLCISTQNLSARHSNAWT